MLKVQQGMEREIGRMINMRLFPLSKPSLTFQEPLAGHTSGATWNMKTEPAGSWHDCQGSAECIIWPTGCQEKVALICKPKSISEQFLKNLNSPGVFYSPILLGVLQLWGDAKYVCGAHQLFWTTTAPAYVPPQQSSCAVVCRLSARHCSKVHFCHTIFVIVLL